MSGDSALTGGLRRPSTAGIEAAYATIDPEFRDTPLIRHSAASERAGFDLLAKVETLNPIRSFKGRGTDWLLASEPRADGALVTSSAGNFGQGLAFAGRKFGRKVIVYAATTANPMKIAAMRRLGAEVVLVGVDLDAAKIAGRSFAAGNGFQFVEDGREPAIAEGAGTIALEMTQVAARARTRLDAVLVPLGNGALLTGMGTWIKAAHPTCRVIGVVAATSPSMMLSWQQQKVVATAQAPTIADGIAIREPIAYALDCMRSTVDDVWSVTETSIRDAMQFCHEQYGLVVEPAGAVGLAAALQHRAALGDQTVATILCGGNMTAEQMKLYLQ